MYVFVDVYYLYGYDYLHNNNVENNLCYTCVRYNIIFLYDANTNIAFYKGAYILHITYLLEL